MAPLPPFGPGLSPSALGLRLMRLTSLSQTKCLRASCQRRNLTIKYFPWQAPQTHPLSKPEFGPYVDPSKIKGAPGPKSLSPANYVNLKGREFHAVFLRDACTCAQCVDPSTKQKNFQTSDIPGDIDAAEIVLQQDGAYEVTWRKDVPGFPVTHRSRFSQQFLLIHSSRYELWGDRMQASKYVTWDKDKITKRLEFVQYEEYMTSDHAFFRALLQLYKYGLLLIRGVPDSEKAVEDIALRIGNLRDTFYGRTWDVKSVPNAKNVAYTAQFLGLHMDLLYMANPPGYQFLHCLRNTCEGGASIFVDAFHAASRLSTQSLTILVDQKIPYQYRNAGEHYYYQHPIIQVASRLSPGRLMEQEATGSDLRVENINYSPPFQAALYYVNEKQGKRSWSLPKLLQGMREFAGLVEDPKSLFEYRLQEGECVVFNNRRILHGRRQFDTSEGERWLKGAYLDTDVLMSRGRALRERMTPQDLAMIDKSRQLVYPPSGNKIVD